ncbi:DNA-binding Lrp family transcriptional regulator [Kineosphaera limosa]|uniref:Putative AsnC family transcriptional regulator n=1 Tax=Kineosphaera limosa NBRC 100340 TaxID=1184609 RepID=K6WAV9_9MICO|nr:Lrp/AsnC family transcriptional regulator [Kineosphaera limosa]NYD99181.1 DNA-binding Lrp family transcriptional regulator [Kineosphaera limosa]GAB96345.1 putative AsnC family transcriptional regulator [Kineosphaera limosa NBRC 100340]
MAKPQPPPALDDIDRRILAALVENAELTNKALAVRLGLAESTCAYRVRALRASGIIRGVHLDLDLAALGCPLLAVVKVRLGSHDEVGVSTLFDQLVAVPGVLRVLHVAGADDFHLLMAVQDAQALRDIVLRHVTVHRTVRSTETQLVFEARYGVGIPLVPDARST